MQTFVDFIQSSIIITKNTFQTKHEALIATMDLTSVKLAFKHEIVVHF